MTLTQRGIDLIKQFEGALAEACAATERPAR